MDTLSLTKKEKTILSRSQEAGLRLSMEDLKAIAAELESRPSLAAINLALSRFLESRSNKQIEAIQGLFSELKIEAKEFHSNVEAEIDSNLEEFYHVVKELDQDFSRKINNIVALFKIDEIA